MMVLGADPGLHGGLVWLDATPGRRRVEYACRMPQLPDRTMVDVPAIGALVRQHPPDVIMVERVHAFPKQGVSSMFTFGVQFGSLRAALMAHAHVPVTLVSPSVWYRHLRLSADRAEVVKTWCQTHLPDLFRFLPPRCRVLPDGMADAAAIAWWGADTMENQP